VTPNIRTVTSVDLDQVWCLNDTAVPHVNNLPIDELKRFRQISTRFLVAAQEGAILGFLVAFSPGADYSSENYQWFCRSYDDFIYVDRIVVREAARRLGIGRALYRHLEIGMRGEVPRVTCEVNLRPRNEESLRMHATLGFFEVGRQDSEGGAKRVSLLCKPIPTIHQG